MKAIVVAIIRLEAIHKKRTKSLSNIVNGNTIHHTEVLPKELFVVLWNDRTKHSVSDIFILRI